MHPAVITSNSIVDFEVAGRCMELCTTNYMFLISIIKALSESKLDVRAGVEIAQRIMKEQRKLPSSGSLEDRLDQVKSRLRKDGIGFIREIIEVMHSVWCENKIPNYFLSKVIKPDYLVTIPHLALSFVQRCSAGILLLNDFDKTLNRLRELGIPPSDIDYIRTKVNEVRDALKNANAKFQSICNRLNGMEFFQGDPGAKDAVDFFISTGAQIENITKGQPGQGVEILKVLRGETAGVLQLVDYADGNIIPEEQALQDVWPYLKSQDIKKFGLVLKRADYSQNIFWELAKCPREIFKRAGDLIIKFREFLLAKDIRLLTDSGIVLLTTPEAVQAKVAEEIKLGLKQSKDDKYLMEVFKKNNIGITNMPQVLSTLRIKFYLSELDPLLIDSLGGSSVASQIVQNLVKLGSQTDAALLERRGARKSTGRHVIPKVEIQEENPGIFRSSVRYLSTVFGLVGRGANSTDQTLPTPPWLLPGSNAVDLIAALNQGYYFNNEDQINKILGLLSVQRAEERVSSPASTSTTTTTTTSSSSSSSSSGPQISPVPTPAPTSPALMPLLTPASAPIAITPTSGAAFSAAPASTITTQTASTTTTKGTPTTTVSDDFPPMPTIAPPPLPPLSETLDGSELPALFAEENSSLSIVSDEGLFPPMPEAPPPPLPPGIDTIEKLRSRERDLLGLIEEKLEDKQKSDTSSTSARPH